MTAYTFKHLALLTSLFFIGSLAIAGEAIRVDKVPNYSGMPITDKKFNAFIKQNIGHVVYLNIVVKDADDITYGYRGVQSTFDAASTGKINYIYYLECDKILPSAETTIEKCGSLVKWDEPKNNLSGYFKVNRIIKTDMKNERAVFMTPVAAK